MHATRKKIKHAQPTSLSYDTMATMAPRPPSKIVPKHNEDSGGHYKKDIGE